MQRIALLSAEEIRQEIAGSREDIETVLPLTPMQRDLYLDTLINPDSPRNNLGSILRTGRTIDAFHGQRVIDLLTAHYSALRLRLIESGRNYLDIAYALVLKPESPEARITLQMVDWSGETLSDEAFDQRCHQLCFRPFAIGREAPLRFFLIRDHHGHDTLLVTAHHTSADGVSVQLLTTRFIELYLAGAEQPPTLPPDETDFQTLGGFVMTRLNRLPRAGDTFAWGDYRFEVVDMDGNRVDKVLIQPNL